LSRIFSQLLDFAKGQRIKNIFPFDDQPDNLIRAEQLFKILIARRFRKIFNLKIIDGSFK
jgi:hypothetical protein